MKRNSIQTGVDWTYITSILRVNGSNIFFCASQVAARHIGVKKFMKSHLNFFIHHQFYWIFPHFSVLKMGVKVLKNKILWNWNCRKLICTFRINLTPLCFSEWLMDQVSSANTHWVELNPEGAYLIHTLAFSQNFHKK